MMRITWIGFVAALSVTAAAVGGCGSDESASTAGGGTGATGGSGGSGGKGGGGEAGSGGGPDLSLQGASCPMDGCPAPLECVTYCGFAGCGGQGQSFSTCEIPCDLSDPMCPDGQTCFSVADGPGEVCQPS